MTDISNESNKEVTGASQEAPKKKKGSTKGKQSGSRGEQETKNAPPRRKAGWAVPKEKKNARPNKRRI